jgi:hypothetical protein
VYLTIDTRQVPAVVTVHEVDVFTEFKVVLTPAEHTYIDPETLRSAAQDAGAAAESWNAEFEAMVKYAASKGWVREDGWIRAHVEQGPAL